MNSLENSPEDEIDLIELLKSLWSGKKLIAKITFFFGLLGIVVSLMSPIVYSASSTFIPQSSQTGGGSSLSGVASLVGINLGGAISSAEIPPAIYPQILESVPYKRSLLEFSFKDPSEGSSVLLKDYLLNEISSTDVFGLIKKYTIMLPFTVLNAIRGDKESNSAGSYSAMSVTLD